MELIKTNSENALRNNWFKEVDYWTPSNPNAEYRLTGQATAPAAVEDTRCALIYIVRHAKELNIDVNRIVIMGGSAGGHLALMAGLLGNDHRFDNNCPGVDGIKVAAIIDKYGITDVWDWAYGPPPYQPFGNTMAGR